MREWMPSWQTCRFHLKHEGHQGDMSEAERPLPELWHLLLLLGVLQRTGLSYLHSAHRLRMLLTSVFQSSGN